MAFVSKTLPTISRPLPRNGGNLTREVASRRCRLLGVTGGSRRLLSSNNNQQQQQQQALHNELSEVMGSKPRPPPPPPPLPKSPEIPLRRLYTQREQRQAYINVFGTFFIVVASARAFQTGRQRDQADRKLDLALQAKESNEALVRSLLSHETINSLAERLLVQEEEEHDNNNNNINIHATKTNTTTTGVWWGWMFGMNKKQQQGRASKVDESKKTIYAKTIQEEMLKVVQEHPMLDKDQKEMYLAQFRLTSLKRQQQRQNSLDPIIVPIDTDGDDKDEKKNMVSDAFLLQAAASTLEIDAENTSNDNGGGGTTTEGAKPKVFSM